MKVYTEILKKFVSELPDSKTLKNIITDHAFEVEEVIAKEQGEVLDLKVLPDRAHDCLSHRGVAREIATHTGKRFTEVEIGVLKSVDQVKSVEVTVESDLCSRYMAVRIENVIIDKSPKWLKESLEALHQKSINTLVDLTNYVLFELGQPLHVFDADKIKGKITIRLAKGGEKMVTLDNKEVSLTEEMLVIADDEGVLALAGVKGGKKAEVDSNTKSIILECGNFDSISIRKTAFKTGIRTDASKRFENNYPKVWAQQGLLRYLYLLGKEQKDISYGEVTDVCQNTNKSFTVTLSTKRTNEWLGIELSSSEISSILTKLHLEHTEKEDTFEIICDNNLFNIRSIDDQKYVPYQIIGHIGRVIGYNNGIKEKEYILIKNKGKVVPYIAETDRIRNELAARGFVEVRTYHFQNEGEEELENPLANDKKYIRSSLHLGMTDALTKATYNAPLLGRTDIFIFEIGTVVTKKDGERIHLALAAFKQNTKKQKAVETLKQVLTEVFSTFEAVVETENYIEIVIAAHGQILEPTDSVVILKECNFSNWKTLSVYPLMTRDIAFFVSEEAKQQNVQELLLSWAGALCVRVDKFDEFEKTLEDGGKKLSQAYRLVFQSHEKTLTDEEVNVIMQTVEREVTVLGCEVR